MKRSCGPRQPDARYLEEAQASKGRASARHGRLLSEEAGVGVRDQALAGGHVRSRHVLARESMRSTEVAPALRSVAKHRPTPARENCL